MKYLNICLNTSFGIQGHLHWVNLSFVKTKVSNLSLKPKTGFKPKLSQNTKWH